VASNLYLSIVKRFSDTVAATILLLLLMPVIALVWLLVRLVDGSPVFFFAQRAGMHGRPITLLKFRTMTEAIGPDGSPLPDGERITPLGRFLRRTSLDELPQLVSVILGEMSMIGPRPLPLRYVPRYSARQAERLRVLPGLTGWAQIHGRNAVDWPERLELDARYVEMLDRWYAPLVDIYIAMCTILMVIWQAITGRGIGSAGATTMREFTGS